MSTASIPLPVPTGNTFGRNVTILLREIRFEFMRALRTRAYSLSVIGFPVMFYILFGLILSRGDTMHGVSAAKYGLGGYAVFGLVGAALFGIGVGVATDLAAGWLELKRASPMPPLAYLLSKCCTAMAFGVIIVTIQCALGITLGHVHLTVIEYLHMVALTIIGAIPFACLGLVLALSVPATSAPGVANMIYLPMSFLSGLWVPVSVLPHVLQLVAPLLPTYHLAQLMLGVFGYQRAGTAAGHWLGLIIFTLIMLGIASILFRRREENA